MSSNEIDPTAELENLLTQELGRPQATVVEREDTPEVVRDAPPERREPEQPEQPTEPEEPAEPEEPGEEEPVEDEEDPYVAWAMKKYGEDPMKWAKAARDMESHITRLTNEKHEADQLATQWAEYAQQQEQQQTSSLPLSQQEEEWVDSSLANPMEYARQAAFNGKVQLFNGVMERVAQENPGLAAQIGAQVQMELQQYVQQQQVQAQPQPLEATIAYSLNRLGIDFQRDGPKMSEKIGELGNYHPYVRAILDGNEAERDLGLQAVYDLTRATTFNSRQVERSKAVQKEEELRHQAGVVQTGGMQPPPPPRRESPLEQAMTEEWKRSGAWPYPEE